MLWLSVQRQQDECLFLMPSLLAALRANLMRWKELSNYQYKCRCAKEICGCVKVLFLLFVFGWLVFSSEQEYNNVCCFLAQKYRQRKWVQYPSRDLSCSDLEFKELNVRFLFTCFSGKI